MEIAPPEPKELAVDSIEAAQLVYEQLAAYIEEIGYSKIFDIRALDTEREIPETLKLDRPHLPGKEFDEAVFEHIGTLLEELIIHKEDLEKIIIVTVQLMKEWLPRLDTGENLVLLTNHMSYADILVLQYCLAAAELRLRHKVSTNKHHAVVGRAVGLMEMNGLKRDGSVGHVIEDALLPLGGVFQTIPPDQGDARLSDTLRYSVGKLFLDSYEAVLDKGGNVILLAGSGIEDDIDENRVLMHRIQSSTTVLLRKLNIDLERGKRQEGENENKAKRTVTTQAVFLDMQPIREGVLRGPSHASIGIGPAIIARKQSDIQELVEGWLTTGNETKLSDTPEITYETKEEITQRRTRTVATVAIQRAST